jgi:AraC-like DNA-binding protein
VLVQGSSELAYGARGFALGPQAAHGAAVLVNLAEPDRFVRQWRRGRSERKVTLTLRPEWFAAAGLEDAGIDAFRREHLAVAPWRPSARALALAAQLASPPPLPPGLQRLWLESRCLDLAGEALGAVARAAPPAPAAGLDARGLRRLCALRDFLDSGGADGMGLAQIARHAGMSAAHLQRHFPRVGGTSVIDYLRAARLQRAREALERGDADVAAAALLAGYRSPANFATAFRRRFGMTPRQARNL